MEDCVFCKIIKKELPANIEYEDDDVIAFDDINPRAPIHILIIPKEHRLKSAADISENDFAILGKLFNVANKIASEKGIKESGYRLAFNVGSDAGAMIKDHIHLHLLGGGKLGPEA